MGKEKEGDSFLSNECMKAIIELVDKHPNDMDLGMCVRAFVIGGCVDPNQLKLNYDQNNGYIRDL